MKKRNDQPKFKYFVCLKNTMNKNLENQNTVNNKVESELFDWRKLKKISRKLF